MVHLCVNRHPGGAQLHFSFLGKPDLTFDTSNELLMTGISLVRRRVDRPYGLGCG